MRETSIFLGKTKFWRGIRHAFVCLLAGLIPTAASAEAVSVKYRGLVDLTPFTCQDVTRSSFVERVCFDPKQDYMLIRLGGTYYQYCEIGKATVDALLAADSMGRFYNQNIKGSGRDGPYDCRTHRVPDNNKSANAAAADHFLYGVSYFTCADWTEEIDAERKSAGLDLPVWLSGYLAAMNSRSRKITIAKPGLDVLVSWVSKYCADHPEDHLIDAAENLIADRVEHGK